MSIALETILVELRQWQKQHETQLACGDAQDPGTLSAAGAAYAIRAADQLHPYSMGDGGDAPPASWPFDDALWDPKTPREDLMRAAGFILAEILKLDHSKPA